MTTGAVWLVVISLGLFLWASGLAWLFGLLDDAMHDLMARVLLVGLFVVLWLIPTVVSWAAWEVYR